jgi:hypothetical protein
LKGHPILRAALPPGVDATKSETTLKKLKVARPMKPAAQKPDRKIEVTAAG